MMTDRITTDPNVHFGKPCITGTRIPVANVLELVKEGLSIDRIIQDHYPDLTSADIQACLRSAIQELLKPPATAPPPPDK